MAKDKIAFFIPQAKRERERAHKIYTRLTFLKKDYSILKTLPRKPLILDVGCGDGAYLKRASIIRPDADIIGIDANLYLEFVNPQELKSFIKCDCEEGIPLNDNVVDYIHCAHLIEHLSNPDNLFKEIHRVLKKGGIAYIEAPSPKYISLPAFGTIGTLNFYDDPTHIRPYTKESMRRMALQAGFEQKNIEVFCARNGFNLLFLPYLLFRFFTTYYNFYLQAILQPILGLDVGILLSKE